MQLPSRALQARPGNGSGAAGPKAAADVQVRGPAGRCSRGAAPRGRMPTPTPSSAAAPQAAPSRLARQGSSKVRLKQQPQQRPAPRRPEPGELVSHLLAYARGPAGGSAPRPFTRTELLESLQSDYAASVAQLRPNGVCHLLWACSRLGHSRAELLSAVAADAAQRGWLARLEPPQLAQLLHSYASLAARCGAAPQLHEPLAAALQPLLASQELLDALQPPDISRILWALAKMRAPVQQLLLSGLADAALQRAELFDAQSIANTVWGLEKLRFYSPALLDAFAELAPRHIARFKVCARA
jgi:hypothetical protein